MLGPALLIMDVQPEIVERFGDPGLTERLVGAAAAARAAGVQVSHVKVGFREGHSEISPLSDGCIDDDDEVHRVLCEKVFPGQADVMTIGEWIDGLT